VDIAKQLGFSDLPGDRGRQAHQSAIASQLQHFAEKDVVGLVHDREPVRIEVKNGMVLFVCFVDVSDAPQVDLHIAETLADSTDGLALELEEVGIVVHDCGCFDPAGEEADQQGDDHTFASAGGHLNHQATQESSLSQ